VADEVLLVGVGLGDVEALDDGAGDVAVAVGEDVALAVGEEVAVAVGEEVAPAVGDDVALAVGDGVGDPESLSA
jgi:hypothetical protein